MSNSPFLNDDEFNKSAMTEGGTLMKARALPVGTIKDWKGGKYIKTAQGWKPKGKEVEIKKPLSAYSKDPNVAKAKKEREEILQSDEFGVKYTEKIQKEIDTGVRDGSIHVNQKMLNYGMDEYGIKADVLNKKYGINQSTLTQMIFGLKSGELGDDVAEKAVFEIRKNIIDGLLEEEISSNQVDKLKDKITDRIVSEIRKRKEKK